MKKTVLLTIIVLATIVSANAQNLSVGGRLGVNYSTVINSNNFDYTLGLNLGGVVNISLNDKFSIQPELLYSQKGFSTSYFFTNDSSVSQEQSVTAKSTYHYLEVPILAKYSIKFSKTTGFINAGPTVGVYLGNTASVNGKVVKTNNKLSPIDFGVAIGVGAMYEVGSGKLGGELRFTKGLTDIAATNTSSAHYRTTNNCFGLYVTYLYPLGN